MRRELQSLHFEGLQVIAQGQTLAVSATMPNPGQSGHTLKSTALINKDTGEILVERAGPISHPELYKRYERQRGKYER